MVIHMLEVVNGAAVALVLKVLGAGLTFCFNVLLARTLGAEGSGVFFLSLTVITVTSVLSRLGLDNTLLRFISSNAAVGDWVAVKGVYRKGILLAITASGTATLIMFAASPWLANVLFSKPELESPLRWMSLALLPMSMLYLHAEMLKGLKRIPDSMVVQVVGLWGFSLIGLYFFARFWNSHGVVYVYLLASLLTACMGFLLWRNATPHLKGVAGRFKTSQLIDSCTPLFVVAIMNMAINWSAIFMLGIWGTKADVGIFSAASRTSMLITLILIAVNSIAAPKFAALFRQGDMKALESTAQNSAKLLTIFASPILLIFSIFPRQVMGVFGSEFVTGSSILTILSIGQFVNVATGSVGYLLMMSGNERLLRNNLILIAIINLFLNATLIPKFGIIGAAVATAVSVSLQNLIAAKLVSLELGIVTVPFVRNKNIRGIK